MSSSENEAPTTMLKILCFDVPVVLWTAEDNVSRMGCLNIIGKHLSLGFIQNNVHYKSYDENVW